jgi:hypothetical protein
VLEFAVAIAEGQDHSLQFFLQGCDLSVEGVQLPFGLSPLPNLQAVDLLGEHEDPILG